MRRVFFAASALAALLPSLARADALALYQAGAYEQAVAEASRQNSAPGYALAARAALAEAVLKSPCLDCLRRVEELARKAIAADPKTADGHVYLAVALGYEARIIGVVRARLGAYPEEAKRNLDKALESDPENIWALAAMGGWNIEVVRGGGAALARWLYGATVEAGLKSFAAAFKAAPDNLVLRYQFALSLAGLDPDAYRDRIADALARAGNAQPQTAYERFAQGRARELLAALAKGDRAALVRLVRRDQGYP